MILFFCTRVKCTLIRLSLDYRKRIKEEVTGVGHRSGGKSSPRVLSIEEEGELCSRIIKISQSGFPLTSTKIRETAYIYAKKKGIGGFSKTSGTAGPKWFRSFMKRHPQLTVKRATQISRKRVNALTKEGVQRWFNEYTRNVVEKYGINNPRNIWNVDETSVTNFPKEGKFVGKKGARLSQVVGNERATTSTVLMGANAAGELIPPLVIHKGCRVSASWMKGGRMYWRLRTSEKGYINDELFYFWGKMFLANLHRQKFENEHHILLMDGHGSHVYNLPFIDDMFQNNVHVVLHDAHTTHATQAMDQYPFESFKAAYKKELTAWCENHAGQVLPHSEFFPVFTKAYDKAMTPKNIKAAFRVTGIYPIDPEAIPDEHYILQECSDISSCK